LTEQAPGGFRTGGEQRTGIRADITVIVGNPKPNSRTLKAANSLAERLTGRPPRTVIDLAALGAGMLAQEDHAFDVARTAALDSPAVIVASPTYRGTYTGLLKVFLDRLPTGAFAGTVAFPLMLGAGPRHALAPELLLKPVLVELGAICPAPGLYLMEDAYETGPEIDGWLERVRAAYGVLSRPGE
jgi:FMN reductase